MKKYFLLITIFISMFLFAACDMQTYYLAASIDTNENIIYRPQAIITPAHFETTVDTVISGNYFLLPETDKPITITSIKSKPEGFITDFSIDASTKTFTAKAAKTGEATITVYSQEYGSASTLQFYIN